MQYNTEHRSQLQGRTSLLSTITFLLVSEIFPMINKQNLEGAHPQGCQLGNVYQAPDISSLGIFLQLQTLGADEETTS